MNTQIKKRQKRKDVSVVKRPPIKPIRQHGHFYISPSTNIPHILKRASDILLSDKKVVFKGMGKGLERTMVVALMLQRSMNAQLKINTGTAELIDDIIPNDQVQTQFTVNSNE
ncbi:Ribonucleases P/MRP protein subunit POP7 [Neolecta irregularis DAH-3]|uniref:Ribonucleases P/MRP protein subunit POP7 n=1 Tax=Neolecta irregularis (strain DAH-3) TaxID=1198029 RepID=A0A1U7LP45_NEOID|nr:Ribonucleases P/MRP protein subunit POP7 [Neolecta irregularis DAH-3]|eukprot:OLL24436.1 Ribonucleases P/MRP protein subunit POP7 [Neolecta irregularis DAH-3]